MAVEKETQKKPDPLWTLLHSNDIAESRNAAIALCRNPDRNAVSSLIEAFSRHEDIAIFCTLALLEIGDAAVPQLLEAALSTNEQIRGYSIEVLGELKSMPALSLIIRAVQEDPSIWVKNTAADALQNYPNPEALNALERLVSSKDDWLSVTSSVALSKKGRRPDLLEHLLERFSAATNGTLSMLSWGIVEVAGKNDVPRIRKLLDSEKNPAVREQVQEIIRGINHRQS